jgi:translocating chain-associated membrane protein 1
MLVQMGFWIHCYPEIYLLKMKKEDVYSKLVQYTASLLIIGLSYVLYLQRLAIVLLVFHYGVEFVYYLSYLLECHGKLNLSQNGFMAWRYLFLLARVAIIALSIYTLGYGVTASTNEEGQVVLYGVSLASPVVRFSALAIVVALQLWLLVTFINYQWMKVNKETHHGEPGGATPTKTNKTKPTSPRQKKKN